MLCVLLLVSGCAENYEAEELLTAAEAGNLEFVTTILGSGQSANVRDICYFTPLMKAAQQGHVDVARTLLDEGGAVDLYDKGGYTALMLASGNNRLEVVKLLLEYGADVAKDVIKGLRLGRCDWVNLESGIAHQGNIAFNTTGLKGFVIK